MGSLLVEEHAHGLARLDPAADDGHQLGAHEILVLLGLGTVAAGQGLRCFLVGRGLHVDRPVGVDVLGVLHLLEEVVGRADVTLALRKKRDSAVSTSSVLFPRESYTPLIIVPISTPTTACS